MEFLDRIGDVFNAATGGIERGITKIFGSSNDRRVKELGFSRDKDGNTVIAPGSLLDQIDKLGPTYEAMSEDELRGTAARFRERLDKGETLDDILPEAFAAVRESSWRYLKMKHYPVQLIGGYILHNGMIAEMVTGEGKTLVSTLPAFLNALAMKVHVITVNDYLAKRDMEWMGPVHMGLGLKVGAVQANMRPAERREQYACDITYGTNNEFGFDYLRDNMKPTKDLQSQGPLNFAIVDEIDNILIDEARTPLIISGPASEDLSKYPKANQVVQQLRRDVDFEVKEKEHTCHLTEDGVRRAEELAGVESFYTSGNMQWPHLLDNALKAHHLYKRDVNYVVENGGVVIVDEFTGRKMEGRQWSDGLHQAVEAKEGLKVKEETQTLATITLQNYFKLYDKLGGMTGTAMTEASEFYKVYGLDVIAVPTNRPLQRINHPDMIFRSEKEKWDAVVEEVREVHATGRPVLVGTTTIEDSELVSKKLNKYGVKHEVLNAKYHEREAEIIAQAGRKNAVTIATNMAGRGTDIILGGNPEHAAWEQLKQTYESRLEVTKSEWDALTHEIAEREGMIVDGEEVGALGGLHVIGTERHDSRRIDLQLRGRAGRQGDPGSSRFVISMEDKLMRMFMGDFARKMMEWAGLKDGESIESKMVTRRVEGAQKKREETHFDQRKNLLEYDEVMDEQRKRVYAYRQQILDGANCRDLILDMIDEQIDKWADIFLASDYQWESLAAWASKSFHIQVAANQVRNMDLDQAKDFFLSEAISQAESQVAEQVEESLPEEAEDKSIWSWQALSKWVNRQYGLNTNVTELKKFDRDDITHELQSRVRAAAERLDFSGAKPFLDESFGRKTLVNWLQHQFTVEVTPEEIDHDDPNEVRSIIRDKVKALYRDKEVQFPVAVGMTRFLADQQADRENLARWANTRFEQEFDPIEFNSKSKSEIEKELVASSERFLKGDVEGIRSELSNRLDGVWPDGNGSSPHDASAVDQLSAWAQKEFQATATAEDLKTLSRHDAQLKLESELDGRYRPELCQAERSLLLEVLDTAWKDHLYHMGHVRDGIGLVGYAQKDPKTEYKREGRRAFTQMWERVGEQVTNAVFRLEKESPAFVGSLWEITAATHAEAPEEYVDPATPQPQPGQGDTPIDPIVNRQPKVGRNDPCHCGSGKKFKKCCGVGV
jgi:preprotein translocase subunit SecA